ncbi:hypothetical protein BDFB_008878, partial [Asbolus verrucosus]
MVVFGYIITSMFFSLILREDEIELSRFFFLDIWSIDNAGDDARRIIVKKSVKTNLFNVFAMFIFAFVAISNFPLWGDQNEIFLCVRVFDELFGKWSTIPYYVYFATFPFLIYTSIRFCFILFYGILHLEIQIFLTNERILKISNDYHNLGEWKTSYGDAYQEEIYKKLCFYIKHHCILKQYITKLFKIVKSVMAPFLLLGTLVTISFIFFLLANLENMSSILKIRIFFFVCGNVLVLLIFCEAGQRLINELQTGLIFDTLMECPWYNWNTRNKRLLLTFMTNSAIPSTMSFAGISLDYRLTISIGMTFIILRKIFIDFAYNKNVKLFNLICIFFHSTVRLL